MTNKDVQSVADVIKARIGERKDANDKLDFQNGGLMRLLRLRDDTISALRAQNARQAATVITLQTEVDRLHGEREERINEA